jgi:Sulfotransferase domain
MPLHVIGAGFGRTGTNSLKIALEMIGFGPCHHMLEVRDRPEQVAFWAAAARRERNDWDVVFQGFKAAVDWPSAYFWREICAYYPAAKVILTVRPVDEWIQSIHATIHQSIRDPSQRPVGLGREQGEMAHDIIERLTFNGRLGDAAYAKTVYEAHIAEVQATIAKERLMVYDVSEGWEPLCAFLDVPVPASAFPRTNSTAEFQARVAARRQNQA